MFRQLKGWLKLIWLVRDYEDVLPLHNKKGEYGLIVRPNGYTLWLKPTSEEGDNNE